MVSKATQSELVKIKGLIATATNARQKAMYEKLLQKVEQQLATEEILPAKVEAKASLEDSSNTSSKSAKKSEQKSQKKPSNTSKVSHETIVSPEVEEISKSNSKTISSPRTAIFQAIGVIEGLIEIDQKERLTITLESQKYRLGYTPQFRKGNYQTLVEEIKLKGSKIEKVSVYPQFRHRENQSNYLSFNLVRVKKTASNSGIFEELNSGEFWLSGFYQYIPLCKLPCITVLRNYSEGLAKKVQVDSKKASSLLKSNHLPVEWNNAPIEAFKYNPTKEKSEQMLRWFVELKANWETKEQKFRVIEERTQASQEPPRYLKN